MKPKKTTLTLEFDRLTKRAGGTREAVLSAMGRVDREEADFRAIGRLADALRELVALGNELDDIAERLSPLSDS